MYYFYYQNFPFRKARDWPSYEESESACSSCFILRTEENVMWMYIERNKIEWKWKIDGVVRDDNTTEKMLDFDIRKISH